MLDTTGQGASFRILGLYPHPRYSGHVVLDENGIVPGSAFVASTRNLPTLDLRIASIKRRIASSVAEYRPSIIVVVRSRGTAAIDTVSWEAIIAAEASGVPLRVKYEPALFDLLVDHETRGFDRLGQAVARLFFPELERGLRAWRKGEEDRRRRPRSAWKAAAGAIAALAETRPERVAVLARAPLPEPLALLLTRSSSPRTL